MSYGDIATAISHNFSGHPVLKPRAAGEGSYGVISNTEPKVPFSPSVVP